MNKRVLILSGTPIISGAEYVLADYLNNTDKLSNFEILHSDFDSVNEFYCRFNFTKNYKTKYLNPVGAVNSKIAILKKVKNLFFVFFIMLRIFKNKEIKIVLGNNTGDIIYSFYSYLFGRKHINYVHDMIEKGSLIAKSIIFFDKFIYKYIAVSGAVKRALVYIGINDSKVEVIYNGLKYNNKYMNYFSRDICTFGFVGNIDKRKNPLSFIKFIGLCKERGMLVNAKMIFGSIIDKELFKKIENEINEKKLNIELIGRINRNEIDRFYQGINYLVLTSNKDPLPTVILEAFNNFTPAIGRNIDGVPEMLQNGFNGFIYDEESDFDKIIKNIKSINYKKMQINANKTIKARFSILKKVEELNRIIF